MKLRKVLIATGILILLAVLIPIIRHYQLRFATNACIAQLKAKGELMDLARVRPPPVPASQNSADAFRQTVTLFNSDLSLLNQNNIYDSMKLVAPGKAIDPIGGQPLRYRLNPDGTFLLYSIGENGKDDGGDATSDTSRSLQFQDGRDWVWPQRATPQDLQNFTSHLPK